MGSQIDGLGHIGIDGVYYNCNKGSDFAQADGLKKLGIEKLPPIATRAVLLDMVGYFGQDPVKEGTPFNQPEIEGALKKQGISAIEKGDVVLFYTGWTKLIGKDNKRYNGEPGLGVGVAPSTSRDSAWLPLAQTRGAWRSCPSRRMRACSKSIRSCCR